MKWSDFWLLKKYNIFDGLESVPLLVNVLAGELLFILI